MGFGEGGSGAIMELFWRERRKEDEDAENECKCRTTKQQGTRSPQARS